MDIKTIESRRIYTGKVFKLRQDQVRMPEGQIAELDIIEHHGAVVIVPVDEEGQIWFIRQYRHPTGGVLLEMPAGTLEPDEDIETCALREVREEIGMSAGSLRKIGEFYIAPGYSTEYIHIFLAKDLKPDPLPGDVDELITVQKIPSQQAYQMAARGEIHDAKTLAALLLLKEYL
jgi:ADP-ribose pyrophosphatase